MISVIQMQKQNIQAVRSQAYTVLYGGMISSVPPVPAFFVVPVVPENELDTVVLICDPFLLVLFDDITFDVLP